MQSIRCCPRAKSLTSWARPRQHLVNYCCLQAARENARAVRGTLTTEVWETHNDTWLGLQKQLRERLLERDPQEFFEWVKFRSHLSRGVTSARC